MEWLSNEKNLLFSRAVEGNDIAQFNDRQWKEVKLWRWTSAYTAAITFNFYPFCNFMFTGVSLSMILTRKTKLVLIRFKQVHFPLQSWIFQCISHFVLQVVSLHFHAVILFTLFCDSEFCKKNLWCNYFKRKKDRCDVIHMLKLIMYFSQNIALFFEPIVAV